MSWAGGCKNERLKDWKRVYDFYNKSYTLMMHSYEDLPLRHPSLQINSVEVDVLDECC